MLEFIVRERKKLDKLRSVIVTIGEFAPTELRNQFAEWYSRESTEDVQLVADHILAEVAIGRENASILAARLLRDE